MRILRTVIAMGVLASLLAACGPLPSSITINLEDNTQDVGGIVQATLQAMTAQAATQSAGLTAPAPSGGQLGSIAGSLNYPSESLPAMYVTAFQVGTQNYRYVITNAGQQTYEIEGLAPGTYHVVAYTVGGGSFPAGLSGGYTQAVPCGLSAQCNDHTLIDVSVAAGQAVTGINPADWYLVDGAFPLFPEQGAAAQAADAVGGGIAGTLMYPSSGIPAMRIVAFQKGTNAHFFVDTIMGQSSYSIGDLPPGLYNVVAYVKSGGGYNSGPTGGYSQMVPCGLKYGCNDHTLIDVSVTEGSTTMGVDPTDFYADPGAFPSNPAP
jgi:RES domain-containing protein